MCTHTLIQKYELGYNWDGSTPTSGVNSGEWTHSVQIPAFNPYNLESYNDWTPSVQIPPFDPYNIESYNDWTPSVQIPPFDRSQRPQSQQSKF